MTAIRVTNNNELKQAIETVRSGDTILLARGTYDDLTMNANSWNPHLKFTTKVTIASEDPANPAVLNKLMLRNVTNIELRDVKFDYVPAKSSDNPFWVEYGRNVSFQNCEFQGEIQNGLGVGVGLRIKSCENVTTSGIEIENFRNGFYATNSTNVDVLDSDFRGMSNDSILMGGMVDVLIRGNDFRNMNSDPNLMHKDAIQFMTSAAEAGSRDVIIRGNVIDNGEETHGIYFTNSVASAGDLSVKHRNILIEDNNLRTAHVHGITVNHGDGLTIRNNVLKQNPDEGYTATINTPRINVSTLSNNVTISGNEVVSVQMPANSSWTVTGNKLIGPLSHWIGIGATIGPNTPGMPVNDGSGTPEEFRIDGRKFDNTSVTFENLDFDDRDIIVLNFFDAGTFKQVSDFNPVDVWNNGGAVKMNSIYDVLEIVRLSEDVTARTVDTRDALILTINQNDGPGTLTIPGMGDAYDALL